MSEPKKEPKNKEVNRWNKEKKKLIAIFYEKDIRFCEVREVGCGIGWMLSFHHRFKRVYYRKEKDRHLLGDFNHVLLTCANCHGILERDRIKSDYYFKILRKVDNQI